MRVRVLIVAATAWGLVGCVPNSTDPTDDVCGESGEEIRTSTAGDVCVYRKDDIVVETGFSCPSQRSNRYDRSFSDFDYIVCATESDLGEGTFDEIEQKAFGDSNGDPDAGNGGGGGDEWTPTQKLDLLWVVDNSGSMCEEQEALRNNFRNMVETLEQNPIDFHIGVTTTHFSETNFESVARPGYLQSTPHPPVGFGKRCRFQEDSSGNRDFTPLKQQINAAVECTKNPSDFQDLKDPSNARIRCALFDECGEVPASSLSSEELFPCAADKGSACNSRQEFASVYREIPKVLRSADYQTSEGELRLEALQRDFACMSFVGTRGNSLEQGLQAATEAVSPSMTGGPVEEPSDESAPNHGLLRQESNFAVTFVTDENDCSHASDAISQRISENACSELNCYFPTKQDPQDPLLSTRQLYQNFTSNLAESKGVESLDSSEVMAASIHGTSRRYSGSVPDMCNGETRETLFDDLTVCNTELGSAKSGDRYADFIGAFTNHVPESEGTGLMCGNGDLQGPLESIAEFLISPQ